jgi:phenylalanyl-tRNA synthetase beta chain
MPFGSEEVLDALGGGMTPPRVLNPLAENEGLLRPSLQPGLLAAVQRNVGRGLHDVALFEVGVVFTTPGGGDAEHPELSRRPTPEHLAALDATLPVQATHVGIALAGSRLGRPADWSDAAEAVLALGRALGLTLALRSSQWGPWHPGRCAEVLLDGQRVGFAGELHPRVVAALDLPARTVTAEANLDLLVAAAEAAGPVPAPVLSPYPPSSVDVALVVDVRSAAADVEAALRAGAGELLEDLRLFDVYTGPQVGEGHRSLAYALRFRAPDRTLTDVEVLAARDAAVEEAARRVGAVLRGA